MDPALAVPLPSAPFRHLPVYSFHADFGFAGSQNVVVIGDGEVLHLDPVDADRVVRDPTSQLSPRLGEPEVLALVHRGAEPVVAAVHHFFSEVAQWPSHFLRSYQFPAMIEAKVPLRLHSIN